MGHVRAFARPDIPRVAELHGAVFGASPHANMQPDYLSEVFLEHPWQDARVPSRVYEEDDGRITGFIGVMPRRMSMGGRRLLAAFCSQFVVHPERRALAEPQLLKAVFEGPQDVSIADEANDATRKIWEGRGGATALLYSIRWLRPLRPVGLVASWLRQRARPAPLAAALRPVAAVGEAITGRVLHRRLRPAAPRAGGESLDEATLLSCLATLGGDRFLRPDYDGRSLTWLLRRAARMNRDSRLQQSLVTGNQGDKLGSYIYCLTRGGVAEVLQLAATRRTISQVFDHLVYTAWLEGATGVSGRLEPAFMDELLTGTSVSTGCRPWMLVHSKEPSLVQTIQRGDTLLSRLDGGWCLRFQG